MSYFESFSMAISSILSNKMRTFLTMIGIIIGIVSVIVIVGLGSAMESYIEKTFESMGANTLTISIMGRGSVSKTVSDEEMYQIMADNTDLLAELSPTVSVNSSAKVGSETLSSSITGVSEGYFAIKEYNLIDGRNLSYGDMLYRSNVAVVGTYISDTYFGGSAVGETIKIGGLPYEIIGVREGEESSPTEGGTDDVIFIPYTTASRTTKTAISSYTVSLHDEDKIDESEAIFEEALTEIFGDEDSYRITNMSSLIEEMQSMVGILVAVLTAIAGISLLVGGIGIMNIMLVSVTERTKEIGIRKSLGAKERYIMRQFIIEAATTSMLGGVIGIAAGISFCSLATTLVAGLMGAGIVVAPTFNAIAIAFGVSVAIGVLFGYLPAKKASLLSPIDALRYD